MKKLITYLKALWSWVAGSQRKKIGVTLGEGAIEHPFSTYSAPFGTCWQPSGKLHSVVRCAAMLVMLFTLGAVNSWGAEEVIYTLTPYNTGSGETSTGYAGATDASCEDEDTDITITWNVTGNSNQVPWRIGGKSITNEIRVIYSKTAISNNVTKVVVSYGSTFNLTSASAVLKVYSTAAAAASGDATYLISSVNGDNGAKPSSNTIVANATHTFARPAGHDWTGRYYRFEFTCTNTSTKDNKYFQFSEAEFYADVSSCEKIGAPTVTATPGDRQISLSWPNQAEASNYTVTCPGGTVGTITGTTTKSCTITSLTNGTSYTWTVTPVGDGSTHCESGNTAASASATPNVYYTVTWMNNGSSYTTTSVASGQKPTFPDNPSSCDGTSTTFVGWTTSTWDGKKDDVSAYTIHTSSSTMPNVSGAITYNAVFAEAGSASGDYVLGTVDDLTEGQTVIIVNSNSGYALSSDRDAYGCQVATTAGISSGTITSPSSDLIWEIELGENGGYLLKQDSKYLNAYEYDGHNIYFDTYPDEWQVSGSGPYVLSSTDDSGYQLWYDGDYYDFGTGTGTSGIAYNMDFYVPALSYSKYLTTCCTPLGEPATLTLDKTAYTITATWTATSGGHEDGYSVQLYNSSSEAIGDAVEIDCSSSCVLSHEFTGRTANTTYYVGVTPTYSGGTTYCSTGTEKKLSVKTDQVYTVTYNNGGGSGTITDSNSPYEAGDEVTVKENTFTKSGYTFTAWSYSPSVSVTDGKFEMPSSNVVITATWTAKKNYYVDRMHGNCDGVNTVTIGGVVYNCYLREGAGYTRPDLTDNDGGTNDCVTGHAHFIGWVAAVNISADGSYSSGTIYAGGSSGTATTDGTIYYAIWAEE